MPKAAQTPIPPMSGDATPAPETVFNAAAWIEKMKAWRNPLGLSENSELPHLDGDLLALVEQSLGFEKERWAMYAGEGVCFNIIRMRALENELKNTLRRASKLRANTPEGIFAKVLLVRRSKTGAAFLAHSLAADMIEMPGLRQLFWPAEAL